MLAQTGAILAENDILYCKIYFLSPSLLV